MKVTGLKTFIVNATTGDRFYKTGRDWVFVKLETDEGITGIGEATLPAKALSVTAAIKEFRDYVVGQDPFKIEYLWQLMVRKTHYRGAPVISTAVSAIEVALWDIVGKKLNVPVYQLLGGACRDRIRVYANGWYDGAVSPEDFAEKAKLTIADGYTALKWDPFGDAYETLTHRQETLAIERVLAVREAVGPDVDLCIEAHGRFNPYTAVRIGRGLEEARPMFFEEPVPPEDYEALAKVATKVDIPIAAGERSYMKWDYADFLARSGVSIIQPDVIHAGGILECRKISAMAEAKFVPVALHNPNGPVATMASIHLDSCIPNFLIQEIYVRDVAWRNTVVKTSFNVKDGHVQLPTEPGLGVELDENVALEHPFIEGLDVAQLTLTP